MEQLTKELTRLQRKGYKVKIISWLSKTSTAEFDKNVIETKLAWLEKNIKGVKWDKVDIVAYGTPKSRFGKGIIFDDEANNRKEWAKVLMNRRTSLRCLVVLIDHQKNFEKLFKKVLTNRSPCGIIYM